ncbi:MAG: glycosyltransferase family 2 protein [Acidimicrobiales bacterium]
MELTRPIPGICLDERSNGVALVSRREGNVVGFALHPLAPGTVLAPGAVEALLDPDPVAPADDVAASAARRDGSARPAVTVAICTRDRPALIAACLRSLLHLASQPAEILVIDNAPSDDRTRRLVAGMPVRYVQEASPGLDFARNRALHEATGDVVAFVDDDTAVDPAWLDGLHHGFHHHPDAAAITGQVLPVELATGAQVTFERRGGFRRGNHTVRFCGPTHEGMPHYPFHPGAFGTGCNMALRRDIALSLGGFDEALDTGPPLPGGGDLDMLHRLVRAGYPLVYEPRAVVFHRHRRDDEGLRRQYESWGRSFMAFVAKTYAQDPPARAELRHLVRRWFRIELGALRRSLAARSDRPPRMVAAELRGGLVGLAGEYGRSVRRAERIRAASGRRSVEHPSHDDS